MKDIKLKYTCTDNIRRLSTRSKTELWTTQDEVTLQFSRRTEHYSVTRMSRGRKVFDRKYKFTKKGIEQFRA